LLLHWKTLIEHAIDDAFLIYDSSDQYIGAFHLEKFNFNGRPYWQTTHKSTTDLTGVNGVGKDISLAKLKSKNWRIDADFLIQGNREILLKGIDWSMENLRLNTHTVEV
jgi:hypothetical protein